MVCTDSIPTCMSVCTTGCLLFGMLLDECLYWCDVHLCRYHIQMDVYMPMFAYIVTVCSERMNILSVNAVAASYHREHIPDFLHYHCF